MEWGAPDVWSVKHVLKCVLLRRFHIMAFLQLEDGMSSFRQFMYRFATPCWNMIVVRLFIFPKIETQGTWRIGIKPADSSQGARGPISKHRSQGVAANNVGDVVQMLEAFCLFMPTAPIARTM